MMPGRLTNSIAGAAGPAMTHGPDQASFEQAMADLQGEAQAELLSSTLRDVKVGALAQASALRQSLER